MYNFIILAQNNETTDYIKQAFLCALSIKKEMPVSKIALVTNHSVSSTVNQLFDHVVPIPWGDNAVGQEWKVHNRWKIIHASPFDEAIILDSDMIVLSDISNYCKTMHNYEIYYTSKIKSYRNDYIKSNFYRKNYTTFDIPILYSAFSFFRKTEFSFKFYEYLDMVMQNWENFYKIDGKMVQNYLSVDTSVGIVTNLLNAKEKVTSVNGSPCFIHMKPNIQGWKTLTEKWNTKVGSYFTKDFQLYIGNYKQNGLFHYTENEFVKDDIIEQYCKYHGINYEI